MKFLILDFESHSTPYKTQLSKTRSMLGQSMLGSSSITQIRLRYWIFAHYDSSPSNVQKQYLSTAQSRIFLFLGIFASPFYTSH